MIESKLPFGKIPERRPSRWVLSESYKTYTEVPYRAMMVESLAWTLPGLLFPKRPNHPRGRLLAFAALNCLSLAAANHALARDPELLQKKGWIIAQSAFTWARYVSYAAVTPKQTYWRGSPDNVAFYTQVWWPIVLWGVARGPRWAAASGLIHGYIFYITSAWANGEPFIPPPEVRRNIANYSNTAWRGGIVCAVVFRALRRASAEAEAEREAVSSRLAAEEEERSIRSQEVNVREDVTLSLMRIRSLGRQLLSPELADEIAAHIDDALSRPWNQGDSAVGSSIEIIHAAAKECSQPIEVIGSDVDLDVISAGVLQAITLTALENVRIHSSCSRVSVSLAVADKRLKLRVADDGVGLGGIAPAYRANHGLTRAREYVQYIGGDLSITENQPHGVVVEAWWPYE